MSSRKLAVFNNNDAPGIINYCFIEHVPCFHHFNPRGNCRFGEDCQFAHTINERYGCRRFLANRTCNQQRCKREHSFYNISKDVIQQVRVFVEAGNIRDGNYVAVLNSPQREINPYGKLELWHKFNFRQSNGETMVEHRIDSKVVTRFQLKTWKHPTDLSEYIPDDILEEVFALQPGDPAKWANPREIRRHADGKDDDINRNVWRVRVDKSRTNEEEAGIEFMCSFKASDPMVPCDPYDDNSEPTLRFYVKFHVNKDRWCEDRRGELTLAEWLNTDDLREVFLNKYCVNWPRLLAPTLAGCLDAWEQYAAHYDWAFRFNGYEEERNKPVSLLANVVEELNVLSAANGQAVGDDEVKRWERPWYEVVLNERERRVVSGVE